MISLSRASSKGSRTTVDNDIYYEDEYIFFGYVPDEKMHRPFRTCAVDDNPNFNKPIYMSHDQIMFEDLRYAYHFPLSDITEDNGEFFTHLFVDDNGIVVWRNSQNYSVMPLSKIEGRVIN